MKIAFEAIRGDWTAHIYKLTALAAFTFGLGFLLTNPTVSEATPKKVTPKVTIQDWGNGTIVGDIVSKDYVCGIPGRVVVMKAAKKKPDPKTDIALKSTKVSGSDNGPFWEVDGLPEGIRVYAVFKRNARCNRALSKVVLTARFTARAIRWWTPKPSDITHDSLLYRMTNMMGLTYNSAIILNAKTIVATSNRVVAKSSTCRGPNGNKMMFRYYELQFRFDKWNQCPPRPTDAFYKRLGLKIKRQGPFVIRPELRANLKLKKEWVRGIPVGIGRLLAAKARIDSKDIGPATRVKVTKRYASAIFDPPARVSASQPLVKKIVMKRGKVQIVRYPAQT